MNAPFILLLSESWVGFLLFCGFLVLGGFFFGRAYEACQRLKKNREDKKAQRVIAAAVAISNAAQCQFSLEDVPSRLFHELYEAVREL